MRYKLSFARKKSNFYDFYVVETKKEVQDEKKKVIISKSKNSNCRHKLAVVKNKQTQN